MKAILRRDFVVPLPLEATWAHLARVEDWPSWARHIRAVCVAPPRPLGRDSVGTIHLSNGLRSAFRMTEFEPYRHWAWVGPFPGMKVRYDHQFEPVDANATLLTWIVGAEGPLLGLLGRIPAWV